MRDYTEDRKRPTKRTEGVLQVRLKEYHYSMFEHLLKYYNCNTTELIRILINEEFKRRFA
jgi:hypothetical protein